jgi:TolA-binding protein
MGWMNRLRLIVALAFFGGAVGRAIAAAPDESRLYRVAEAAFKDGLNDLAERQFVEYLKEFPDSERVDEIVLDLAQAQLNQGTVDGSGEDAAGRAGKMADRETAR